MQNGFQLGGIDIVPPKDPLVVTLEIEPEELELAFATDGNSLREKLLKVLILAMIEDTVSM
jgi:hypothetical protein